MTASVKGRNRRVFSSTFFRSSGRLQRGASRSVPDNFVEHLPRWPTRVPALNLVVSDHAAIQSLPECLDDETPFDRVFLDRVQNRPQGTRESAILPFSRGCGGSKRTA